MKTMFRENLEILKYWRDTNLELVMEEVEIFTTPLLSQTECKVEEHDNELYKSQIKQIYQKFNNCSWIFKSEDSEKIHIFEDLDKSLIKMECILHCDFLRFATVASDRSVYTREKWDPSIKILTSLLEIHVNDGKMYLVNWERSLAIQWIRKSEQSALIIYSTCTHPHYRSGNNVQNEYMIRVKHLDRDKCFFSYVGMYRYEDARKIEQVCMTSRFRAIYDHWECHACRIMLPAHELECRRCKQARYTRCVDKKCFREQRQGVKVCEYCGMGTG